jgi:hypothetical protein
VADDLRQPTTRGGRDRILLLANPVGAVERAPDYFQCRARWCGREVHAHSEQKSSGWAGRAVLGKGQANPEPVHGGAYAPYMVERWTKV